MDSAFAAFTEIRRRAGVRAETVRCPEGDETFVVIDLEFDTTDQAHAFLHLLGTQVWAVPANSPALGGTPEARILETVELARTGLAAAIPDPKRTSMNLQAVAH